jgi:ubiquinone/menaquinone biosynthesis C-methylase UbiE
VRGDLRALPLADHGFDLVTLGFWFSHHPRQDYGALFGEIHRLLAGNGRVWMIDNNPPAEGNARRLAGQDQFGNQLIRRWLSNGREFVILKNYFTEQQLRQVLEPQFELMSITHKQFYWAVELCLQST